MIPLCVSYTYFALNTETNSSAFSIYSRQEVDAVLAALDTTAQGLTTQQAVAARTQYGSNVLKSNQVGWLTILIRQYKSPFIYILLVAALLAYGLGELIDGTIIILFVFINTALGFYQEFRSEQALKVLKQYTAQHTHVIRNGVEVVIPTQELVPGDTILLQAGDIVPADARLMQASNLTLDESLLTGESEPSSKTNAVLPDSKTLAIHEASNIVFSGSSVISGAATAVVIATGVDTYIGGIAKLTTKTTPVSSFEKGMNSFSTFLVKMVGVTLFLVFFANILIKGPTANLGDMILFIIALAAAVIPEALPLVITFSLSRGALRLSKHKVVVKRLSAIEDLGGIEILCTDKTGTITENKLTVADIYGEPGDVLFQAKAAISAHNNTLDPFDVAIQERAQEKLATNSPGFTLRAEIPFDPERKCNSVIIESQKQHLLIVRGAAEALLANSKNNHQALRDWIQAQELQGRRVLIVAHMAVSKEIDTYDTSLEKKVQTITGALSFADPLKSSAAGAVKKAQKLGVLIKIITGDSAIVAGAIAQEIGLIASPSEVITGADFFALRGSQQREVALRTHVFARFSPLQKHQLIELLQQEHEVGFMGDGINDAPALKTANVALVVKGASDIARESADVILLNPSLTTIIDGIQEGREVFANTIKYVKITLASNFGNFYAIAMISLFTNYLPMLAVQILLVNLLSDFPLIAVATDAVDQNDIRKPEGYNLKDFALTAIVFGIVSSAFDFLFFGTFFRISPEVLQTNWFIGSILTELLLLYSLRTKKPFYKAVKPSMTVITLTVLAAVATVIIPFTEIGQRWFHFVQPTPAQLATVLVISLIYFAVNEAVKLGYYRFLEGKVLLNYQNKQ